MAERGKTRGHAAHQRGGGARFARLYGKIAERYRDIRITGRANMDGIRAVWPGAGERVQIDGGGQHAAALMVGMVAADLGAAGAAEQADFAVRPKGFSIS